MVEIQATGEPLRYECEICDSKFDGNVKYTHLAGVKHRHQVVVSREKDAEGNSNCLLCKNPASARLRNDAVTTSFQRIDVASTSIQRRSNVMCWLGRTTFLINLS